MALVATRTVTGTIYVLLKNERIYVTITGATSMTEEDDNIYDMSTHSQLIDASMTGNPHFSPAVLRAAELNSNLATANAIVSANNMANLRGQDTVEGGPAVTDSIMCDVTKLDPAPTWKGDSVLKWWNGSTLVAWMRRSRVQCIGPALPVTIS